MLCCRRVGASVGTPLWCAVVGLHTPPRKAHYAPHKAHYEALAVHERATINEIKCAYYDLSKKLHPDSGTGDEDEFKRITEAYEILVEAKKIELDGGDGSSKRDEENVRDFFSTRSKGGSMSSSLDDWMTESTTSAFRWNLDRKQYEKISRERWEGFREKDHREQIKKQKQLPFKCLLTVVMGLPTLILCYKFDWDGDLLVSSINGLVSREK